MVSYCRCVSNTASRGVSPTPTSRESSPRSAVAMKRPSRSWTVTSTQKSGAAWMSRWEPPADLGHAVIVPRSLDPIALIKHGSPRLDSRAASISRSGCWCRRWDSNPHEGHPSAVFKTAASAIPPLQPGQSRTADPASLARPYRSGASGRMMEPRTLASSRSSHASAPVPMTRQWWRMTVSPAAGMALTEQGFLATPHKGSSARGTRPTTSTEVSPLPSTRPLVPRTSR